MKVSIETDIATGTFVMAPGHRGRTGQLSSVETGACGYISLYSPSLQLVCAGNRLPAFCAINGQMNHFSISTSMLCKEYLLDI